MFTNNSTLIKKIILLLALVHSASLYADYFSGLPTHDQNPLLTGYWIPHTIASKQTQLLNVSTSLFISNTLHDESNNTESLLVDGEIYRLDINFQYELEQWVLFAQLPYISTSGGFLDNTIVSWHDFFRLPQGERLRHQNNALNYQYNINGQSVISQQQAFSGVADISLGTVYKSQQSNHSQFLMGFGLNLASAEENPLISNQATDYALWMSYLNKLSTPYFLTIGITFPSNDGVFKNRLNDSVWFAQTGFEYAINPKAHFQLQLDYHSEFIKSQTDLLSQALQIQLGLKFKTPWKQSISLFFSEDILVGSTPDITFGLAIDWQL